MLRRALIAAVAGALLLPGAAGAAKVTKVDATTLRYDASAGIRDIVNVNLEATKVRFDTFNVGDTLSSVGCDAPAGAVIRCDRAGITRILIFAGDNSDVINNSAPAGTIAFTIDGGTGDDGISGSAVADVLRGGEGGDVLRGRGGADDLGGGSGFDRASFFGLTSGVDVSLDDHANDGRFAGSEGGNVRSDVENLVGTDFPDTLTGSAAVNDLDGEGGDDVVDGRGGIDSYEVGEGDDTVTARDGLGERIVCGAGDDTVTADDIDEFSDCETTTVDGLLVRDLDHDGIAKPGDCNDADATVRPGAADVPDDGVDQDCNGVDATIADRDGDGVPRPFDCDDANPQAAPGKPERFGNKVDEDCNGRADPLQSITTAVRARFIAAPGGARITRLQVVRPRRGTTVQVRCKGAGCGFAKKSLKVRKGGRSVNLRKRFKLTRIAGQVLEVRLLRSDSIGRVTRFSGRGSAIPATRILCLEPGKRRPGRCG